jgi:Holliday junction resolvase-like predicted endonuclease
MPNVLKASGQLEPFSEDKLRASIKRAGIPQEFQDKVISYAENKLYDNIPTSEIYKHIMEFLQDPSYSFTRTKYSLKQSVMDLGPTGYPFEDYTSEILKMEGYATQVRQILRGKCVSHEIDIVMEKNNVRSMVECKFHNVAGTKSQIHVSLYTKARFDDVKEQNNLSEVWLITNTKITQDALDYALCSNMKIISWDYPASGSFRDLIGKHELHPVTMLTSISSAQKQQLLENHTILARDVCKNPSCLDILGLPNDKKNIVLTECRTLYKEG